MTPDRTCPDCGASMASETPLGICPRCVLRLGMAGGQPTSDFPVGPMDGPLPGPEGLAQLFPHLEILEPLGVGGMGVVYKARQTKLDRLVALKLIRPESATREEFAARFEREARAMARLNHPHIGIIHDFGEAGGLCYLVMELVEGDDLRKRLDRGPFEVEAALGVALQVCGALQFAHERGVVHRDIKPENILIDAAGRLRIVDFGLAKLMQPAEGPVAGVTASRQVLGTPRYMAPEQLEAPRSVDHRADIYAVGLVLYEMMTGEVPFGRYELLSERIGTDESLDEILKACLARAPDNRYKTVRELRKDLAEFAAEEYELTDPTTVVAVQNVAPAASSTASSGEHNWGWVIVLVLIFGLPWYRDVVNDSFSAGWDRFVPLLIGAAAVLFGLAGSFARQPSTFWVIFVAPWFVGPYFHKMIMTLNEGWDRLTGIFVLFALGVGAFFVWLGVWSQCQVKALPPEKKGTDKPPPDPVARLVRGPALGLILVGAVNCLGLLAFGYGMINLMFRDVVPLGFFTLTQAQAKPFVALSFAGAVTGAVILLAGLKLLDRSSFAWAWVASFVAMIPFTLGCVLGLPIGIWTLSVLSKPEVLAAEEALRRRTTTTQREKPIPPDVNISAIAGDSASMRDA
jgi:tRNA A-37 threonylcarbamoyl transferase component Bud32